MEVEKTQEQLTIETLEKQNAALRHEARVLHRLLLDTIKLIHEFGVKEG